MQNKTKKQNITVLGCGRWGSFVAWYLDKFGFNVTVWGRKNDGLVKSLFETHKNEYVEFPESITLTHNLDEAMKKSEIIIISISSQQVRDLMKNVQKVEGYNKKFYCLNMKGIEESTGMRLSEVLNEHGIPKSHVATWVGPGHIQDFVRGVPSVMIIDSTSKALSKKLIELFSSELIRFQQGNDMIGTEIGAAAKNVIGLAAGMLDGLNYKSLKGSLMVYSTREIGEFIKAVGGKEKSAYGLCHLGDYEATLFSEFSHNRQYGEGIVKGIKFEKLAEGVSTARIMERIAKEKGLHVPLVEAINKVISNEKNAENAMRDLFKMPHRQKLKNK